MSTTAAAVRAGIKRPASITGEDGATAAAAAAEVGAGVGRFALLH